MVKKMMTSMMITMIADAELNAIRSLSSDMLDTVLKMTDFDNSNFKSNKKFKFCINKCYNSGKGSICGT